MPPAHVAAKESKLTPRFSFRRTNATHIIVSTLGVLFAVPGHNRGLSEAVRGNTPAGRAACPIVSAVLGFAALSIVVNGWVPGVHDELFALHVCWIILGIGLGILLSSARTT